MTDEHSPPLTLAEASRLIHQKEITPTEVVTACLEQIEKHNETLHAFLHVMAESALQEAQYATDALGRGEDWGPLHGIPIGIKDLIDVEGEPMTAGSDFLRGNIARRDAEVVTNLKAEGAIIIGKTHLHEFAIGATNINPHYPSARNPWNPEYSPGGSSGGSGAAVSAGMCLGALGTDTGGSVRLPSAFNNLTGLRPAVGHISTDGVIPLSWSLDTVGPMAHTAEDIALMMDVLAPRQSMSYTTALEPAIHGLAIAIPEDGYIWQEHMTAANATIVRKAINLLEDLGGTLRSINLPDLADVYQAVGRIALAEAGAVHEERMRAAPGRFGADVRSRIELGMSLSAVDYANARHLGRKWRADLTSLFRGGVDVIALPTCPVSPPPVEGTASEIAVKSLLKFTYPFSLSRLPSLSIPCGFTEDGFPLGLQLVGPSVDTLLRVGHAYQGIKKWHEMKPPLD